MSRELLAIDPGINGGLAWIDEDGIVCTAPMPEGMSAQADFIRNLRVRLPHIEAILEKTGTYQPGNSGPGAATFARHCGSIEAILYCYGIPTIQVAPQKWQAAMGSLPKDKAERKLKIKEEMARRHPHLTVTLKTSDSLAILEWGMSK
jgi:hypothetical protein